jgi:flagellar hook-associated protein 1 FlgK
VEVQAVVQKVDLFLEGRLRGATSDRAGSEVVEQAYSQLEGLVNELGDTDLSTSLNSFFSSIAEILNQPESVAVRNLAVLEGNKFAQEVRRMAQRVGSLRTDLNDRVHDMGDRINKLTSQIQTLNIQIAEAEGGDVSASDAVGLRDNRMVALEELATLIDIRVQEQPSGGVTVYSGGDFLVFEGTRREVEVVMDTDRGIAISDVYLSETHSPLSATGGELAGLKYARDDVLGDFLTQLDDFASTIVFEFNKVFSSGQGLRGYEKITSEFAVDETDVPLNQAGLTFKPVNGSFQVMIHNRDTGLTETTDIQVDLNGMGDDTSLEDLVAQLDAVDGVSASLTATRHLQISSDSSDQDLAFADDTSGVLAALGVNTFFAGTDALSMNVSDALKTDPSRFAASRSGVGADTDNAVDLADMADREIASRNGTTIRVIYSRMTSVTAQGSTIAHSEAEGNRVFEETLRGQKLAISGVSIDEEAVKIIAFQHSFSASARFISAVSEMLDLLVNL